MHTLIEICQAHGNDARNVRDAAHEAFHALVVNAKKSWDREKVHRALKRKFKVPAMLWLNEMQARAVEQIVSQHFEYACAPLETRIHLSIMEAIKFQMPYGDFDTSLRCAQRYLTDPEVQQWAGRVIALTTAEG